MAACLEKPNTADIVQILLNNGANASERNVQESTPLHSACQVGQAFVVMLLLDQGCPAAAVNSAGDTALDIAARNGHRDVVTLLLEHEPSLRTDTRALREAAKTGKKDVARLLLDLGLDCTASDLVTGDTALHEACRFVRAEVAEHLLAFGADAEVANAAGETPIAIVEAYPPGQKRDTMLRLIRGERHG